MPTRAEVYEAIDGERKYQAFRWNQHTTSTGGFHSVTEWLTYIRDYAEEGLHHVSRNADPDASEHALHTVRKIAALGVACMEDKGAPRREGF
jgi:hypothetical protein